jgi:hypothetical protein
VTNAGLKRYVVGEKSPTVPIALALVRSVNGLVKVKRLTRQPYCEYNFEPHYPKAYQVISSQIVISSHTILGLGSRLENLEVSLMFFLFEYFLLILLITDFNIGHTKLSETAGFGVIKCPMYSCKVTTQSYVSHT